MDLETEIARALTALDTTSAQLRQLIEQDIAAAAAADEEAEKARAKALDPTRVIDTQTVSTAIVNAELKRDRLKAAVPRLQQRFTKVEAAERYVRWIADFDAAKAKRDAAAAELLALYPVSQSD